MKPLPMKEIERVFKETMDDLDPDARERVLDELKMKAFVQMVKENPNWYEDNPELERLLIPWMQKKMDELGIKGKYPGTP